MAETQRPPQQPPGSPAPVGAPSAPARTGGTVVVACRIPHGLRLRVFDMVDKEEPTPMGFKTVKMAEQVQGDGAEFVVRGPGRASLTGLSEEHMAGLYPGGYALTQGCPVEIWNRWLADNRRAEAVTRDLVFAEPTMERARNRAADLGQSGAESGLEPVDQFNPGRRVRGEGGLKIERGDQPARR